MYELWRTASVAGSPEPEATPPAAEAENVEEVVPEPSPERPTSLRVEAVESPAPAPLPVASPAPPALSPAGSTLSRRDSQLTDRGYFDVKFYHNKLW